MESTDRGLTLTTPSDREIKMTRTFNAPRRLVFEALTRPEQVKQWYGRHGDTMPVCEIDLRVGGALRFVSRGPDGQEVPFKGRFLEITEPERLVYTWALDIPPFADREGTVTVTLEEKDGRTTMTETSLFPSTEERDGVIATGMQKGAADSFERMESLLNRLQSVGSAS